MSNNVLFGNSGGNASNQSQRSQMRGYGATSPDHLQFYSGAFDSPGYSRGGVSGTSTPMMNYSQSGENLSYGGRAGWMKAFGSGGLPGEPPLLEGITYILDIPLYESIIFF